MFESFIAPVINKILGDYVGNLESKQLSIGIWQGDVALHNLRLKKDALEKFNLPVEVLEGHLGDLTLSIPWNDLKNKPVKIFIDKVFLLARPKAGGDYDPIEEEERLQKLKRDRLETAEMMLRRAKEPHIESKTHDASFMTQLVTKIVDNVQIVMKNVHIRYEDNLSSPENPFSVGITLEELSAVSCDLEWNEAFIHEQTGVIRKLSRLGSLAIYFDTTSRSLSGQSHDDFMGAFQQGIATGDFIPLDHQYILKPVSGNAKLKMHKLQPSEEARCSTWLEFNELGFVIDKKQYSSSIALLGTFSAYLKAQKYRKFRPPRTISPKLDPTAWFKFAGKSILSEIHDNRRRWTWEYFAERRNDRRSYVELYKRQKGGGNLSVEDQEALHKLESKLSFEDIMLYRSIAMSQLRKSNPSPEKVQPKEETKLSAWTSLSTWWSGRAKAESPSASTDNALLTDEQMKQLYDTIDFDPQAQISSADLPKNAMLLSLKSHLQSGSLALKESPLDGDAVLLSLVFEAFDAGINQYVASLDGTMTLGNMALNDRSTKDTLYSTLIRAKNKKREGQETSALQNSFFKLHFDHNPLDGRADDAVSITMLPLEVIYNPLAINNLVSFFTPPTSELETVSTIQAVAHDTFEGLTAQTKAGLEYALEEHKTLDLKIDFAAPIFLFPQSCTMAQSMVLLIDAGHLLIESNYVNKEKKRELQQIYSTVESAENSRELTSLLYDRFSCQLSSVQMLIGHSLEAVLEQASNEGCSGDLHVIERVNMGFCIEMCILPKLSDFPRIKISGNLPRLHLNLSDKKYKVMMSILDIIANRGDDSQTPLPGGRTEYHEGNQAWKLLQQGPQIDYVAVEYDGDAFYDAQEEIEKPPDVIDSFNSVAAEVTFAINHASISLMKSETAPDVPDRPLAELSVDTFGIYVRSSTQDLDVKIRIKAVEIEDKMQSPDSEFRYLLSPTVGNDADSITSDKSAVDQLIRVRYRSIKPTSPEYAGVDQKIDISFAAVTVVLTSNSVLMLYDFILSTFTSGPSQTELQRTDNGAEQFQLATGNVVVQSSLSVRATMRSIGIIVNRNGTRIATATFGALETTVLKKQDTLSVTGSIGDLALVDDVLRVDQARYFRHLLQIEGDQVAHFAWSTFSKTSPAYPGYDSALSLRACSIRVTWLEPLVRELMDFFSQFREMHLLLDTARRAAIESAHQIQEAAGKFHYDIEIQSPVLELPRVSLQSKDILTLYPGQISAKNTFRNDNGSEVDEIIARISSMKLIAFFARDGHVDEHQMLEDVNVDSTIWIRQAGKDDHGSSTSTNVSVSDIRVKINPAQYAFLLELADSFRRFTSDDAPSEDTTVRVHQIDRLSQENQNLTHDTAVKVMVPSVCLEIFNAFEGEGKKDMPLKNASIARFSLSNGVFTMTMNSDGSAESELQVQSFSIQDTREKRENIFRDILPSTDREDAQLVVHLNKSDCGRSTVVTITGARVIVIPKHIFLIRDFFVTPMNSSQPVGQPSAKPALDERDVLDNRTSYRIDLVDLEVILLHDAADHSTEAICLSSRHLAICQEHVTILGIREMGMFLCQMDKREETNVPFIQTFDSTFSMDRRIIAPGHSVLNIAFDLSPIALKISYRDILLIMDIANGVNALWSTNTIGDKTPTSQSLQTRDVLRPVTARERLHGTLQGLTLTLIDDLNDLHLPMLELSMEKLVLDLTDWSSMMRVETAPSLSINYFNVKNSHWEPLLEPWQLFINAARQNEQGPLSLEIFARKRLDVNVTHTFVETVLSTVNLWNRQERRALMSRRGMHAPYIFRNRTGYDIYVWADSVDNGLDTELKLIPNSHDLPWRFEDWRTMRERNLPSSNRVSVQLKGPSWETLKGLSVDVEGLKTYVLRPAINRVAHRLVCEVALKNNVKIVTFRSGMSLKNETTVPLDIIVVNSKLQRMSEASTVGPREDYYVPIEASYYNMLQIRPQGFGYDWSGELLFWSDLQKQAISLITCRSGDPTAPPFQLQINSLNAAIGKDSTYPMMTVKVLPPFQLENLLPYDFRYNLQDRTTRQLLADVLQRGCVHPLYTVDPTHLLALTVEITDYAVYGRSEVAIITNSELDYRDETLRFADKNNQQLLLRIKYHDRLDIGGKKVSIYSPYVLLNKTGLDLLFSTRSLLGVSRYASPAASPSAEIKPTLFSFPNFEPLRSRVQLKSPGTEWSKPISFDAVGSSFEVTCNNSRDRSKTYIGVTIKDGEGKYYLTKSVTFTPRFVLKNNSGEALQFRQHGTTAASLLPLGQTVPLTCLKTIETAPNHICVRLTGLMNEWSNPFDITQVGLVYIKLGRMSSPEQDLIRAEVLLKDATVFVIFTGRENRWPFRVENRTNVDVEMWQQGSKLRYRITKEVSQPYAWDYPSAPKKVLILSIHGREREVDVLEIGQLVPFKYPSTPSSKGGVVQLNISSEGPAIVIRLTPYVESKSIFKDNSSDSVSESEWTENGFQMKGKEANILMTLQLRLEGIGVSLVNKGMQELLYASARNVLLAFMDTTANRALSFSIKWLQIDNQLYGGLEPIFLYPTVIPKEGDEEYHPVLMLTLSRSKDPSYGVDYFDWFIILLQELSVDMDEEFLAALINFSKFNVPGWDQEECNLCDTSMSIPEPPLNKEDQKIYFEKFLLQPIQINVSFVRTQTINMEETRPRQHGLLSFVLDVLTMTLGNIHDAPLRLNALQLRHANVTSVQLLDLIMKFYSQELIGQIHKVIGSADFLGNPVGLFNNVSSGVSDFFYEPLQGFEITRPQDFGIGVAKGAASLFRKTVFGVSDTFSKFTGSLGKGLSVITMDSQERRRLSSIRNRPRHAVYGVTTGATSLARSVASGITGVVSKPLEGAQEDGVGGFFKGLGKGIVGVVTKPVIGVIDLATNVGEGIRNTTTVFDADLDRQRLPRHIGKDKILTTYNPREALGLNWLKGLENGRYFHEQYIAHFELRIEDLVAIVTDVRVLMARIKRLKIDWEMPFDEMQLVRVEGDGISLIKKGRQHARARLIPCPDLASAKWLCAKIEEAFADYIEQLRS